MSRILLAGDDDIIRISKALSSTLRMKIIKLLEHQSLNVNQIADRLGIPQSTCVFHVKILEVAGILKTESEPAVKGLQKICRLSSDEIVFPLTSKKDFLDDNIMISEIPIGMYSSYEIHPPCGIISDIGSIGLIDRNDSFNNPHRAKAGLIWFTRGYCEYRFPDTHILPDKRVKSIAVSMEICSEFPGHNNEWKSDITLWFNEFEIGTWRSPSDCGGEYGQLTPRWWSVQNSQYGFLKSWKITDSGSFIDGERCSDISLRDLDLQRTDYSTIRIGIKDDAEFPGGINIFGRTFGNQEQDIRFTIEFHS